MLALMAYQAKNYTKSKAEHHKKIVAKADEIIAASDEMKSIKSKLTGIESVMGMKGLK